MYCLLPICKDPVGSVAGKELCHMMKAWTPPRVREKSARRIVAHECWRAALVRDPLGRAS